MPVWAPLLHVAPSIWQAPEELATAGKGEGVKLHPRGSFPAWAKSYLASLPTCASLPVPARRMLSSAPAMAGSVCPHGCSPCEGTMSADACGLWSLGLFRGFEALFKVQGYASQAVPRAQSMPTWNWLSLSTWWPLMLAHRCMLAMPLLSVCSHIEGIARFAHVLCQPGCLHSANTLLHPFANIQVVGQIEAA